MEATLRPYDRGEEVTLFATLGLYHALPCPTILRLSPLFYCSYLLCCSEGRRGRSKNEFYEKFREQREAGLARSSRVSGIPGPPQLTNVSRQDRWRDLFRLHGWQDSATVLPALRTPTVAVLST